MEYYSAIKKNEIMPSAATGMDLETIILGEVSQRKQNYMISLICCYCSVSKLASDSATTWTAACQASLSFTVSQSLLRLMSIEPLMSSNHRILSLKNGILKKRILMTLFTKQK